MGSTLTGLTMSSREILLSGLFLWLFAVAGTTFVAVTENLARDPIIENERRMLLRNLNALLPAEKLDNDIVTDTLRIQASSLLGTKDASLVYRARYQGEPVAAIFNSIAPNGYSGKIHLLVGVYYDGSIAGVRAVKHNETPGLGDAIEIQKSDWILDFNAKSLGNPPGDQWLVKRDKGVYDQFTGATITPRAIVQAVKNTLLYYERNAEIIF
ncbi:MAG: electron transport complex subunit RsxG [Gammaproteobacteria bacterium]|nr:electron transport complex subunit RsxG [Gammaproteobacteria bacterium]